MRIALTAICILAILALFGCGSGISESVEEVGGSESSEHGTSSESSEEGESSESGERGTRSESGEHSSGSESGEHGEDSEESEDGEESGTQYGLDDTYDNVRVGARLIVSYHSGSNTFTGTVENVTNGTLKRVRVEVHLSNGIELGPTTPVDLAPGQRVDVILEASSRPFETWSAHPEVG